MLTDESCHAIDFKFAEQQHFSAYIVISSARKPLHVYGFQLNPPPWCMDREPLDMTRML